MAEAVKQFFVGFIHPRTWLAALIGIIAAVIAAVAVSGFLTDFFSTIFASLGGGDYSAILGYLSGVGWATFGGMLLAFSALTSATPTAIPLLILIVGGVIAGLIFGLTSKKERVLSKGIIGGLNIGVIYIAIITIAFIFWTYWSLSTFAGFTALYNAVIAFLQAAPVDILVSFLVVWWVSAMVSILILSLKHE